MLGPMHPDTLTSVIFLAALLGEQGKLGEAEALAREALAGRRSVLGDAHPNTEKTRQLLLDLPNAQGRHREALELKVAFPCGK